MAKKPASVPGPKPERELAEALNRHTEMLSAVYDLLARFKDELTWLINNRQEFSCLRPAPAAAESPANPEAPSIQKPEIIACSDCDAASPTSLAAALQEGWTELEAHEGEHWNYIGLCPDCLESAFSSEPPPRMTIAADLLVEDDDEPDHPQDTLF